MGSAVSLTRERGGGVERKKGRAWSEGRRQDDSRGDRGCCLIDVISYVSVWI